MMREINGYHVLAIFGGGFAVVIAANLVLATQAVRTFPGLEVKNSYVASQSFDAERAAQQALGWTAGLRLEGNVLRLDITDATGPVEARIVEAKLGRKTFAGQDRLLSLAPSGGAFVADAGGLAPGAWHLWFRAEAPDGTIFRQRLDLWVPG